MRREFAKKEVRQVANTRLLVNAKYIYSECIESVFYQVFEFFHS